MRPDQRGFALMIVLWTVGFLALLGTQIVAGGRADTRLTDNLKQEATLQAAADGAVSEVMFLMLAARDARMQSDGQERMLQVGDIRVVVRVENEGDRVNLNRASAGLLQALITGVGATPAAASRLAGAILDWRSSGTVPARQGAKAADYRAAGKPYGPPETPFQSVDELTRVLGMTSDLAARLAPHLTVLTEDDPNSSTRDPVVARALSDAGEDTGSRQAANRTLRIAATALGQRRARYAVAVVARADFQGPSPRITVLSRERRGPEEQTVATARKTVSVARSGS